MYIDVAATYIILYYTVFLFSENGVPVNISPTFDIPETLPNITGKFTVRLVSVSCWSQGDCVLRIYIMFAWIDVRTTIQHDGECDSDRDSVRRILVLGPS